MIEFPKNSINTGEPMSNPSSTIIQLLSVFAIAFTAPAWAKALTLLYGTILAPGRRTVAAALRAMGLADDEHFTNYHRLLNRDCWSPWVLSKLLLSVIIALCLLPGMPLILAIDDTLERRRGSKIKYKGWFRDAVRSTASHVSKSLGIRWICLAVLVPVPWSHRLWALPFMVIPALGPKTSAKLKKKHRTLVEWAIVMVGKVRRWQPEREIVLVGDGGYAAVPLVQHCQRRKHPVKFVSRLRLDARLFDLPAPQPQGKRGPKPKKGARQPSLAERLADAKTQWQTLRVPWYDGQEKDVQIVTGVAMWHRRGLEPVQIRWVLVRCPEDATFRPTAYFCSAPAVSAEQIVRWFVGRWNIEVTFEEVRAHLGFETQRQWSDKAIERTTPCLFGTFSVVVLMAQTLHPETLPIRQASWYPKEEATFSDALAAVRKHLWSRANSSTSTSDDDMLLIPRATLEALLETACYST
jgi:hypothetical protein